ncbi:MAG: domain containing protein [Ferruginibacter sp.]|nr:domain containing protein [Ferruginibacter sp.]
MDKRIIWYTLILIIIAGALFAYLYYNKEEPTNNEVDKVNFTINPKQVFVEDNITYEDHTKGATNWLWEFGDAGGVRSLSQQGTYKYFEPGRYTIRLTINEEITDSMVIIVNPRNGPGIAPMVIISGPSHAYIGDKVTFTDNTPGAQHTIWKNMDNYETVKDSKTYTYIFTHKGDFEITASNEKNTGSDGVGTIRVHVDRRPAQAVKYGGEGIASGEGSTADAGSLAINNKNDDQAITTSYVQKRVSDKELLGYFQRISANGSFKTTYPLVKKATDNDESIPVLIVNKDSRVNKKLYGFCQYLNIMRPALISITTEWDATTNTIKKIVATVKEKPGNPQ